MGHIWTKTHFSMIGLRHFKSFIVGKNLMQKSGEKWMNFHHEWTGLETFFRTLHSPRGADPTKLEVEC